MSKTNRDLEIRRRFALSLASESLEFPSRADIQSRIEPMAYEEGLGGAIAPGTTLSSCAELVETAVEMFVKEVIGGWFGAARTNVAGGDNGASGVQTARFRRQLRREEQAAERGEVQRNAMNYLPVEAEAVAKAPPLSMDEVRLALRLDPGWMRLDPYLGYEIHEDGYRGYDADDDGDIAMVNGNGMVNGVLPSLELGLSSRLTNGVNTKSERGLEGMSTQSVSDELPDWGWTGARNSDRDALMDVLGSTLAVGS